MVAPPFEMPAPEPIPDIHDITPPVEIAEPTSLWVYAVAGLALLAVVGIATWLLRRKAAPAPGAAPKDARERALDSLHALKRDYATLPPDRFAEGVVEALRLILASRFGAASRSLTPDEFFAAHGPGLNRQFDPDRRETLARLLALCDRMRFAPEPDHHTGRLPLAESALAFVRALPATPPTPHPAPPLENDAHPSAA